MVIKMKRENGMKFKTHQHYYLKDGNEVCGVTTILGQLNKSYLMMWAYKLAQSNIKFWEVTNKSKNIGTIAHYLIECYLRNIQINQDFLNDYSKNEIDSAYISFGKFKSWFSLHEVIVLNNELQLVSEKYRFGGTMDIVAYVDKVLTIIDIKSGSGVYDEMIYQLSAYRQLYNENFNAVVDRCLIIHIPHEKGDLAEFICEKDELDKAFLGFYHLLKFYLINKEMKK